MRNIRKIKYLFCCLNLYLSWNIWNIKRLYLISRHTEQFNESSIQQQLRVMTDGHVILKNKGISSLKSVFQWQKCNQWSGQHHGWIKGQVLFWNKSSQTQFPEYWPLNVMEYYLLENLLYFQDEIDYSQKLYISSLVLIIPWKRSTPLQINEQR